MRKKEQAYREREHGIIKSHEENKMANRQKGPPARGPKSKKGEESSVTSLLCCYWEEILLSMDEPEKISAGKRGRDLLPLLVPLCPSRSLPVSRQIHRERERERERL